MSAVDGLADLHVGRGWSLVGMGIGTAGSCLAKMPYTKRRKKAKPRYVKGRREENSPKASGKASRKL